MPGLVYKCLVNRSNARRTVVRASSPHLYQEWELSVISHLELKKKIEASVPKSLAEGLRATVKGVPPFGASEEADSDERQRDH
jgi:hypothetical protein